MSKSSIFAKVAFAAIAGAMALGGSAASAQPYGGPAPAYGGGYDPCQREASGRGIVGALVGGGLGATVGSQMAASGHRTDGSLLGGVLGALAGAKVGNSSAACNSAPPPPLPPPPRADYGAPYAQGYDVPPPPPPPYRYGSRAEEVYVFGHRGERLRIVDRPVGADGCTLAESPIYMPDGRVQKRFVRVCQDSSGRYQVVD